MPDTVPPPPPPPEPADLHTALAWNAPLDWGDPIPTRAQIAERFGPLATDSSLRLIKEVISAEAAVTQVLRSAVPPGCVAHQLEHRIKSPQSLARKLADRIERGQSITAPDVVRYTVVAARPAELVAAARATVGTLLGHGWQMESANHSYVAGNRYKGLHAILRNGAGAPVEVQFHSGQSMKVKELTTPLYATERDGTADDDARARARAECVRLSAGLEQPAGIDRLATLGGKRVDILVLRDSRVPEAMRQGGHDPSQGQGQDRTRDREAGGLRR